MKRALILVGIVMAFVGVAAAQAGRISTRQWKLVELNGTEVDASSRAYLELESGQTRFTGHTGCNRMFGSIQIQGQRVDFSGIGTTRMACVEAGARRIEAALLKALENVDRWEQKDNSLSYMLNGCS